MHREDRARRAVVVYLGLCFAAVVPLLVLRSEGAASWLLFVSLLALPWTRLAGGLVDHLGLAPWTLVPMLAVAIAIDALVSYLLFGGRFRPPH
jgi:hypothetical protein